MTVTSSTQFVTSRDGTRIAYDRIGDGPALVIVGGATSTRSVMGGTPGALGEHFTVYSFDRRGRGDSGDTAPYAVEREIEDIAALIEAAGGSARLFGHSSGAVLALRAAAAGLPVERLAVYEPPFIVDDSRPPVPDDYVATLDRLIAEGKREEAVIYFMTVAVGIPEAFVEEMRQGPYWQHSIDLAHTLAYDSRVMGDTMSGKPLDPEPWNQITVSTLVMAGGASEPFMRAGAQALVSHLPRGEYKVLEGQDHGPADEVLVPELVRFLTA